MAVIGRLLRAVFFVGVERENHVIGHDWRTVMLFCLLP
jgi:hypothetical protein